MSTLDVAFDVPEADEQDKEYDAWIRAELTRRMQNPQGTTPHDQVMAEMDALIARIAAERQAA